MRVKSLAILLIALAFPSRLVYAERIYRTEPQSNCLRSLSLYYSQNHSIFARHVPKPKSASAPEKPGLCGPTCLTFIGLSLGYSGGPILDAGKIMDSLHNQHTHLGFSKNSFGWGMNTETLGSIYEGYFRDIGYSNAKFQIRYPHAKIISTLRSSGETASKESIPILLTKGLSEGGINQSGHFILITGRSPSTNRLYYLDPNDPKIERSFGYVVRRDGSFQIISPDLLYLARNAKGETPRDASLTSAGYLLLSLGKPVYLVRMKGLLK